MSLEAWGDEPDYGPELPEGWWDQDQVAEAEQRIAELEARVAGDDPVRALIAKHAGLLADGPYAHYCYFELAYTRHTGWMAWICSNQREEDPDRKVLAKGQGWTPDEACRAALADLTPNVELTGAAPHGQQTKPQETEK